MKRTVIYLLFCVFTAAAASAQTVERQVPQKTGDEWQMPKDVLLRSQAFSERLKTQLRLDSVATRNIFNLYLANTKAIDEIKVSHETEKQKKSELDSNQAAFDQKVGELVTPKQFEQYRQLRKAGKISL